MASEYEAADALPSDFDMNGLSRAFGSPSQIFRLLDKTGDGRVTKEDLRLFKGILAII